MLSSDEGWAVGRDLSNNRGVLLSYRLYYAMGISPVGIWTLVTPPSVSSNWYPGAVHFTSSSEGWAVGRDNANKKGVLLRYVKGTWSSVAPPEVSSGDWALESVHFISSSQGCAGGNDGKANRGVFLRYSKGSWKWVASPNVNASWDTTGVRSKCSESWSVGNDVTRNKGVTLQHTDASLGAQPNLVPYRPKGWSDKIVVSNVKGGNRDSATLSSSDHIYVSFAVVNDNQVPFSSGFYADLYVDGTLKKSWWWLPLSGCHYASVKDYLIGPLSAGIHSVKVMVRRPFIDENPGEVYERDEGDNTYEKTITVKSSVVPYMVFDKPTGRVERLSISKTRGMDDDYPLTSINKLYVSWSVQNNGGAKTPGKVTVRLYVDGSLQKSWSSSASVKPSKRWEKKDQPIGKLLPGEHEIKLVVDAGIPVPETNKGDNEVVKKINIQKDPVGIGKPTLRGPDTLTVGQEGPYQLQGVASACANGMEYYVNWGDGKNEEESADTGWVAWGQVSHSY